ncbi:MAG: WbqC family protein [Gammaproteobacteria bacterium]
MKTICIHQPDFAPYLGFFHRLLMSDRLILLDDVQFIRRGWHHRDRIKSRNGPAWLTLSLKKDHYHQQIRHMRLSDNPEWIDKSLNLLAECYRQAPYFDELFPRIEAVYRYGFTRMIEFNRELLELAFEYFDINIPVDYASRYSIKSAGSQRLLELVRSVDGTSYLTGTGSKNYLDEQLFTTQGVKVTWQQFNHPVYPQLYGEFVPMLSCFDVMFNCGGGASAVLRSSGCSTWTS